MSIKLFGYTLGTDSTPGHLPPLASSSLAKLTSAAYFNIPEHAVAADQNQLAVEVLQGFNARNGDHLNFIRTCTAEFQAASQKLKAIDKEIVKGLGFSLVASVLSVVPFLGFIGWACSWVGLGYAVAQYAQRQLAYRDYNESMKLLIGTCNWAIGPASTSPALVQNDVINTMMKALYPVLTREEVKLYINDDIENAFVDAFETAQKANISHFSTFFGASIKRDDKATLAEVGAKLEQSVYGFGKGAAFDTLEVFFKSIPAIFAALKNGFSALMEQQKTPATPSPAA
ncbi:MAG: hypothetical protein ACOYKA_07255 [Legionellaceae bacterium]